MSRLTQTDLHKAAHSLNRRPRQTLNGMTPSEKLAAGFLPNNRDRSDRLPVERLASYGATVVTGAVAGTSVSDVGESSPDRFTSTTISTTTATMATMAAITVPNPPLFCVT